MSEKLPQGWLLVVLVLEWLVFSFLHWKEGDTPGSGDVLGVEVPLLLKGGPPLEGATLRRALH